MTARGTNLCSELICESSFKSQTPNLIRIRRKKKKKRGPSSGTMGLHKLQIPHQLRIKNRSSLVPRQNPAEIWTLGFKFWSLAKSGMSVSQSQWAFSTESNPIYVKVIFLAPKLIAKTTRREALTGLRRLTFRIWLRFNCFHKRQAWTHKLSPHKHKVSNLSLKVKMWKQMPINYWIK